jgi:hypothetical protein
MTGASINALRVLPVPGALKWRRFTLAAFQFLILFKGATEP